MSAEGPALKYRFLNSAMAFAMDATCRFNSPLFCHLYNYIIDPKRSASDKPINGVRTSDVVVDSSRNLWFRLYTPTDTAASGSLPVIVYFHGGGFILLAANSTLCDDVCRKLAGELPAVIVSVNYRLALNHRCPSQYDDGIDVLKFIDTANIQGFPCSADLRRCFLAGDSAGGNLAHHVAVRANEYNFRKLNLIGLIAVQPFFGGEERTESEIRIAGPLLKNFDWLWKAFLPEGSNRDHPAANVFGPNAADISGINFPPAIVVVGGLDAFVDWQRRYYEGLKQSGKEAYLVEYPNAFHGIYIFPRYMEAFINDAKNFIRSQCAK